MTDLVSPDRRTWGHFCRLLWCQFCLPARLAADRVGVLYSTVEEGLLWRGVRQVVTCHDVIPLLFPDASPRRKYVSRYVTPLLLRASRAVICVSENTKADVIAQYGVKDKPIFVVHNGLNHERFRPTRTALAGEKYGLRRFLLYVGDTRPYKNLERALGAFARLRLPDRRFVIVGRKDNLFFPRLLKRVAELRLGDRVVFPGYVPADDLPHLYGAADAFVFPSLYEGFGMPPLEAMACGCPVVTSRAAAIPEVCGDAACYVDPRNVDSIAQGIGRVVSDLKLRKRLVEKGLERAEMFSWRKTARQVLRILEGVRDGRLE